MDYCNTVLAGLPHYITDTLQRVLNLPSLFGERRMSTEWLLTFGQLEPLKLAAEVLHSLLPFITSWFKS